MSIKAEEVRRFEDIMSEILTLVVEAAELVPRDTNMRSQAEAYWSPHIQNCVEARGCMVTMQDTLEHMREHFSM